MTSEGATKVHAVTGVSGRLVDVRLTPGQRGDAPVAEVLLDTFRRGQIGTIIADAAYDSDARQRGAVRAQNRHSPVTLQGDDLI